MQDITKFKQKTMDYRKYKMCRNWVENQTCHYGDRCNFAHGGDEIVEKRITILSISQRKHALPLLGCCTYGHHCLFLHENIKYSSVNYNRMYGLLSKKQRLKMFEKIAPSDDSYYSKFSRYLQKISEGSINIDWSSDHLIGNIELNRLW